MDGWTFLDKDKMWVINGYTGYSSVHGNKTKITDLQQDSRHRFQRPDFKYVSLDTNATSLNGFAGRVTLNKQKGNWIFNSAFGVIDPGFDTNDLGFLWRTNLINAHIAGGYKWTEPGEYFRRVSVIGSLFGSQDFDGNNIGRGIWFRSKYTLLNYYFFGLGGIYNPPSKSLNRTRGGPLTINKGGLSFFSWFGTDSRKELALELEWDVFLGKSGSRSYGLDINIDWKPADNLTLSLSPGFNWNFPDAQWVGSFADSTANQTYGERYVFANMHQITFSSSIRINWTFSPELSLQVYVQPLISSGDYSNFKYLTRGNSYDFIEFGRDNSSIEYDGEVYSGDADGNGPAQTLSWDNPDFTFTSLRANAVMRWEYQPGSTIFLVWTQNRSRSENNGHIRFHKPFFDRFLNNQPDNIFLVKMTYWLGI